MQFYTKTLNKISGPFKASELYKMTLDRDTLVCEKTINNGAWQPISELDLEALVQREASATIFEDSSNIGSEEDEKFIEETYKYAAELIVDKNMPDGLAIQKIMAKGVSESDAARIVAETRHALDEQRQQEAVGEYGILKKFNWGAFAIPGIWGLFNGVYWPLGAGFLLGVANHLFGGATPMVTAMLLLVLLLLCFYVGATGNKEAWKKCKATTIEDFERRQKGWSKAGVIVLIVSAVIGGLSILAEL